LTVSGIESSNADEEEGLNTAIRLIHTRGRSDTNLVKDGDRDDDYLIYGTWETNARSGLNPDGYPKIDAIWSGSIPYTNRLRSSVGTARFTGTALGHYKSSNTGRPDAKADWEKWDGNVVLDADFATDQIEGKVYTGIPATPPRDGATGAPGLGVIGLGQTGIQENVDGTAKIADGTGATGSWEANFYGTRAIQGQPSGVAGGFRSERPFVTFAYDEDNAVVKGQSGAIVQGAFGAHNTGPLDPK